MTRTALRAALLGLLLLAGAGAGVAQNTGSANFTRYVALGDSLTAGFNSGGLVRDVQINSYPALIFRQATGGGAGFEQPLVGQPGAPPLLVLTSLTGPTIVRKGTQNGPPLNLNLPRPYNNLAVPGANARDVVVTVTGGLHDLVLRGQGTQLQQAVALQPTFATLWIGNNDVLGAALSGRVIDDVTLTTVAKFEADFRAVVNTLVPRGAKLAIANIPDVTALPFVTTIARVVVNPATQQPVLVNGQPVPLIGPSGPLGAGDFVLLSAADFLRNGVGIPAQLGGRGTPLPDEVVLSAGEVEAIRARTNSFNNIIQSAASQAGAALVDVHGRFNEIVAHGLNVGGITYTTAFLTGGLFSFDGVHPTAFGYAFVANLFIAAINSTYGAEIPPVNLFPFMFGPEAAAGIIPLASTAFLSADAVGSLFWALRVPQAGASGGEPKPGKKPRGKGKGKGGRR
jgi:lysophospholipase L1-like esterase